MDSGFKGRFSFEGNLSVNFEVDPNREVQQCFELFFEDQTIKFIADETNLNNIYGKILPVQETNGMLLKCVFFALIMESIVQIFVSFWIFVIMIVRCPNSSQPKKAQSNLPNLLNFE